MMREGGMIDTNMYGGVMFPRSTYLSELELK